jgi:hypothetical protein
MKQEATFGEVLDVIASRLARRRQKSAREYDVQVDAWALAVKHHNIIRKGILLRSFTGFVVEEVFKAEREDDPS